MSDMEPFGMNVSFFAIDLDRLNAAKPQIAGKMFRDLISFLSIPFVLIMFNIIFF